MPEGDTVHKLAAALRPQLVGERIKRALVRTPRAATTPTMRHAHVARHPQHGMPTNELDKRLFDRRIEAVYAHGKHLFFEVEGGLVLRSHLGMYGSWHRYRSDEPWRKPMHRASLALWTELQVFVCFNAAEVELTESVALGRTDLFNRLGPDLLARELALEDIVRRCREFLDSETPLVDVLLDQRIACGIGNVYKSEILFLERLDPNTKLVNTSDEALHRLYRTARRLLRHNLGGGPRVTRLIRDGRARLWVYARHRQPCLRCGSSIESRRLGRAMRSTYWCPACQPPS